MGEAVDWCGQTVTVREAARLRRLATVDQDDSPPTTAQAESGGAGAGTKVG